RQLGDPRDLAAVLRARWVALWRPETAEERLAIADEIVHLGERTADRELALLGRRFRIVGFLEHGDVVGADREIEAWAQIAGELRQPLYLTDLPLWRPTRANRDGRLAERERHAPTARRRGRRAERPRERGPALRPAAALRRSPRDRGRGPRVLGVDLDLPRAAGLGARPRRRRDAALRGRGAGPRAHRRATLPRVDPVRPCAPAPHMRCWRAAFRGDGTPRERARDRAGARDGWAGGKDAGARFGGRGDGRRPGTGRWRCGLSPRGRLLDRRLRR